MKTLTIESKTHGTHHVILDDEDYDRVVAEGKWGIVKDHNNQKDAFYVRRNLPTDENGKRKSIQLHRFIMDAPKGKVVDHINGDGRDNRKENLRICTFSENSRNRHHTPKGKFPYYGVTSATRKHTKRFKVQIRLNVIGPASQRYYYTAEEAAMEYDKLAKEYHGEFATLNFPDGVPPDVMQKIIAGQKEYEKIRKHRPAEKQSKQKGVNWNKRVKRWRARLNNKHLGWFKTEQEAIDARFAAEAHGAELDNP
jgi:hypothetical protein